MDSEHTSSDNLDDIPYLTSSLDTSVTLPQVVTPTASVRLLDEHLGFANTQMLGPIPTMYSNQRNISITEPVMTVPSAFEAFRYQSTSNPLDSFAFTQGVEPDSLVRRNLTAAHSCMLNEGPSLTAVSPQPVPHDTYNVTDFPAGVEAPAVRPQRRQSPSKPLSVDLLRNQYAHR